MRRTTTAIAVLLLVSACGGSSDDDAGSPSSPDTSPRHRAECVVSDPQGEVIIHPGSLTPPGALTLSDVTLTEPVGLDAFERDVVRFTGRPTITGVIQDYPPLKNAGIADSLADWDQRRPLRGLDLTADDGQQAVLVALRLTDPDEPGHLNGVRLTYRDASGDHEESFVQPLLVKPHGTLCTVDDYDSTLSWVP